MESLGMPVEDSFLFMTLLIPCLRPFEVPLFNHSSSLATSFSLSSQSGKRTGHPPIMDKRRKEGRVKEGRREEEEGSFPHWA